jgi:3-phytase
MFVAWSLEADDCKSRSGFKWNPRAGTESDWRSGGEGRMVAPVRRIPFRTYGGLSLLMLVFFAGIHSDWGASGPSDALVVRPAARLETQVVPSRDDAADDPAIWVHPESPELSLILGTDKKGALHVYNMDGTPRGRIGAGTQPNNVDVTYEFPLGGETVDLAVASTRGKHQGLKVWSIDPRSRELADVSENESATFPDEEPYGCCTYRSPSSGKTYAFVTFKSGLVEQYELAGIGSRVRVSKVASLKLASTVEGCVADDELRSVFIGEENEGIWKFSAEPEAQRRGILIAQTGKAGLKRDVEGLALYYGTNGGGYLIASSQGNNTFKVYERAGEHRLVATIDPRAGEFGDVEDTDGIAVTSQPTSRTFAKGLFIAQDGKNRPRQNFKLFAWEDIAGETLRIETGWSPRRKVAVRPGGRGGIN